PHSGIGAGRAGSLVPAGWLRFGCSMVDFYVGDWHFATFNLADSAICIGAALIVLEGFLPKPTVKEQA
ncbi:signal peptidase II, partial [Klebsiella pneumoniae]|nr:signal peptidase II [Klebsiella pneumoniae]